MLGNKRTSSQQTQTLVFLVEVTSSNEMGLKIPISTKISILKKMNTVELGEKNSMHQAPISPPCLPVTSLLHLCSGALAHPSKSCPLENLVRAYHLLLQTREITFRFLNLVPGMTWPNLPLSPGTSACFSHTSVSYIFSWILLRGQVIRSQLKWSPQRDSATSRL